ncbi:MAG: hypothetical protein K2J20_00060, partial [Bacilli bacterium]|nr:hypothetical protein [Bacilli bacterium]
IYENMNFIRLNTPEEIKALFENNVLSCHASQFHITHDGISYVIFYPVRLENKVNEIICEK